MNAETTVPVVEIFGPTLQGEGTVIGRRTMFIRFGYCDGVGKSGWCNWCDSLEAVNPKNKASWRMLTAKEILAELRLKAGPANCYHVTLTGGNPLIHDLEDLTTRLHEDGFWINVETQGTIYRPWLQGCDDITVSPKPPSAGIWNEDKFKAFVDGLFPYRELFALKPSFEATLKIVVDPYSEADLEFARYVMDKYGSKFNDNVLSALTRDAGVFDLQYVTRHLADKVLNNPAFDDVRVLFQYHKFLWGNRKGV